MSSTTVVLAHGVLGFGNPFALPSLVNYFNGVASHLTESGHTVIAPQVNPFGTIAQRAEQLAIAIRRAHEEHGETHVIAHSMGGLDSRHAITHLLPESTVRTLITIGTPHLGSPVADAIASRSDPLLAHVPALILMQLERNAGALHDLTTSFGKQFDSQTPDVAGVRYIEVAGDASKGGHELFLFQLAAVIGRLSGEVNDGVVTRSSALRPGHEHLPDWPVDHAGEIGWSVDTMLVPGFLEPHLARYEALLNML